RAGNITGFVARSSEKVGDKAAGAKCPEATLHLVVEDICRRERRRRSLQPTAVKVKFCYRL
ncbi:MAG: hypothetical protein ACYSUP_08875, partial [Planctomycetota bacterium]